MTHPRRLLFATAIVATVLAGCSDPLEVPDELTTTRSGGAFQPSDGLPGGVALAESAISCTGKGNAHYGPPLGPTPEEHTVTVTEKLGTFANGEGECVGPVAGGHAETVFVEEAGCLVGSPEGTLVPADVITYHWDNGTSSTVSFTATTVTRLAGQAVITAVGSVVEGFKQGALAHAEKITVDLDIQKCLEGGIENQPGDIILTIGDVALE